MGVEAVGPRNAQIALVGEAPGDEEVRQGTPFVGVAGKLLDGMLAEAGLRREDCYITNILQEQPDPLAHSSGARNNFGVLYNDKARKIPSERLTREVERLRKELHAVRPHVVLALGNEALKWLTTKNGITDWRGSVLPGEGGIGKVVATYHPAAILRFWDWRPVSVFDYVKAKDQSAYPEIRERKRVIDVAQSVDEACQWIKTFQGMGKPVSFDIEVETQQIQSIALSNIPGEAIVIPIWWGKEGSKWAPEEEFVLWEQLAELFASTPVLGQNVHYDLTFLKMYDVYAKHLYMDTMVAFHVLYPELPKGLDFMTSIYTDQPYYKFMRTTPSQEEFWQYNGLDAMVTLECSQEIEKELRES